MERKTDIPDFAVIYRFRHRGEQGAFLFLVNLNGRSALLPVNQRAKLTR
jgi:hypothetical protein